MQIGAGTFASSKGFVIAEFPATDPTFIGFILGETYTVTIDGVTADYVARNFSPLSDEFGPIIGTATTFNMEDNTFDGWFAAAAIGIDSVLCAAETLDTSFVGKTISISQIKTETVTHYKTKLLPEYLLPAFLRKNVVASKTEVRRVQTAADNAQSTADSAQAAANAAYTAASAAQSTANTAKATANNAQAAANTAKSTADEAKTKAANAYTKASIAETTAQNAVSFTTTQSLTDTEKKRARDNIGASSFSGVQPDWNQNDETQPDYVKNRPFYTGDPVETVLVEESTVSFVDNGGGRYSSKVNSTFSATVGETYKVSWDGTVYECTCIKLAANLMTIGNLSFMGEGPDTGEPFIMLVNNGKEIVIGTTDTSASHTFSIICNQTPIVKIPAKYIDKNSSGYVVIHSKGTMTQQEAENYWTAISTKEVVFIMWGGICFSDISFRGTAGSALKLITQNGEYYYISKNSDGLFNLSDMSFDKAILPNSAVSGDNHIGIDVHNNKVIISKSSTFSVVGSTDTLFQVQPDGAKSKSFDVLGNGEAVAPALILYSSTADSTKKFRITVDDTGTLKATEVT